MSSFAMEFAVYAESSSSSKLIQWDWRGITRALIEMNDSHTLDDEQDVEGGRSSGVDSWARVVTRVWPVDRLDDESTWTRLSRVNQDTIIILSTTSTIDHHSAEQCKQPAPASKSTHTSWEGGFKWRLSVRLSPSAQQLSASLCTTRDARAKQLLITRCVWVVVRRES